MYRPQKKLGQDFMAWPTTTKKYNQSIPSSSLLSNGPDKKERTKTQ